mgnify:CR=1 FL=1
MKNLYEILIPVADNDGKTFSNAHVTKFWDLIIATANGLTVMPNVKGFWVDGGRTFTDENTPLRVVATKDEIRFIAHQAKSHFNQLAILYYKISDDVVFKTGED